MSRKNIASMNLSSPNLVNVCIDTLENGEIRGRMYHYYGEQPVRFESILQLLELALQECKIQVNEVKK